jgi:hypothetical protein
MDKIMKYIPLALFLIGTLKGLAFQFSWIDAAVVLVLGTLSFFYKKELQDTKVLELEKQVQELSKNYSNLNSEFESTRSYISSIKLGNNFKKVL